MEKFLDTLKMLFSRLGIIPELVQFLMARKKYWLIPFVIVIILFGLLLAFVELTGVAPFIYPLF
ncbi:MAG TPA: DUF5989 family protein [Candidatus Tripitaka californicus]|jgi:hypothetical protein|uniref:DUF5989 family protein n=1 Tax=Candidatus Tripitaka californicus TaxID=3367616 RepID=UPI0040292864|nr:hypothetical protein [Planctomycetota bacterium]